MEVDKAGKYHTAYKHNKEMVYMGQGTRGEVEKVLLTE